MSCCCIVFCLHFLSSRKKWTNFGSSPAAPLGACPSHAYPPRTKHTFFKLHLLFYQTVNTHFEYGSETHATKIIADGACAGVSIQYRVGCYSTAAVATPTRHFTKRHAACDNSDGVALGEVPCWCSDGGSAVTAHSVRHGNHSVQYVNEGILYVFH